MIYVHPYAICTKDHLTVLQCRITVHKSNDCIRMGLFMDSLFRSIGLFAYPCPRATVIKIRLVIRLYKSSYFYSSSRLSWLFLAPSIFIKIYNQLFLVLREWPNGRGCCITICWCMFGVKTVLSDFDDTLGLWTVSLEWLGIQI